MYQLTEYRDKSHPHDTIAKQKSKDDRHQYKPLEGELSAKTTFQSDYVAHPVQQRSPKPTKTCQHKSTGVMLLKTTYTNDFRVYPAYKTTIATVKEYKAPTTKMDTQSGYNDAYCAWEPQPKISYKKVDNLKVNEGKLDMTTTFQVDYCPKTGLSTRKSFKPKQKLRESLPFEGKTVYSQVYVPHRVQQLPPKSKVLYKPSSTPFQAISTHRQDFKGDRSSPVQYCKAKATWEPRSTPFDGRSECQDKFQAWAVRPPSFRKAAMYSPPEGNMELISTAHADFRGTPGCPASSAWSATKAWSSREPFAARSTTQDDFKAWKDAERSESHKPKLTRRPLSAFEGITTFRAAFTPKIAETISSFKPVQRIKSLCTMDCDTIYHSTFRTPCPAISQRQEGQLFSLGKNGYFVAHQKKPMLSPVYQLLV